VGPQRACRDTQRWATRSAAAAAPRPAPKATTTPTPAEALQTARTGLYAATDAEGVPEGPPAAPNPSGFWQAGSEARSVVTAAAAPNVDTDADTTPAIALTEPS
jgi:hypothetical protein